MEITRTTEGDSLHASIRDTLVGDAMTAHVPSVINRLKYKILLTLIFQTQIKTTKQTTEHRK